MFSLKYSFGFLITFFLFSAGVNAQSADQATELKSKSTLSESKKPVEINIDVKGICGMCKKRIEKAALINGVKLATWDKEANNLRVIYRADKVTEVQIHEAVADAGHDTELEKSTDEVYQTLPGCCAYREGVKVH